MSTRKYKINKKLPRREKWLKKNL